jgi:hypothetical protein
VQILNPDEYLRPEKNATVKFLSTGNRNPEKKSSAILVPGAAVRDRSGKKIVLIAYNGRALARDVHVVSQRANGFLVEGLTGGENVITAGPASLKDGDKIKIKGQS